MISSEQIPSDTVPVVAGVVNFSGLVFLTSADITYKTAAGTTRALTSVPSGLTIICQIVEIVSVSGTVLGYK